MADTSGWFALAGALGGGAIGVVTTALSHRWQMHNAEQERRFKLEQQLRQERRETYATYWTAWNTLIRILEQASRDTSSAREVITPAEAEWRQTIDPLFITCSPEVLQAGIAHVLVTEKRISAAVRGSLLDGAGKSRALSRAMRADLGV
ncbi:hypothetical protein [Sphaerimonospora mesophila]|uniref:hypothetical protein n=1 Tax=Sphaerimonospora mesophila TaxID=37483 RepID=UPI0006E41CDD